MKKLLAVLLFTGTQLFAQQTSLLFLGNSYTYTNNMPDLLYQLSLAGGDSISWDSNTPGGYTFQNHTQDATSLSKINSRPWNFVILQGQSEEPAIDSAYVAANVFPYAGLLDSLVHVNDSCTQTIFFMTWGRKNGDASYCPQYPPVCTFAGMQQQLENRYLQMGNDNHAVVAPVGEAWKNVIATNPAFDLYIADESHPSLYGSYLTACVFYATIYRRSPAGINFYAGLPVNEATLLQTIAGSTVLDSLQLWNTEIYYPDASFTFTQSSSVSLDVSNSGINASSWYWNTGSGYIPGTPNQTLNFPSIGTYTVCLAATNNCLSDTSCQVVNLATVGIGENQLQEIKLLQDISSGGFSIQIPEQVKGPFTIHVYDTMGKETKSVRSDEHLMQFENFVPGVYFIKVEGDGIRFGEKTVLITGR